MDDTRLVEIESELRQSLSNVNLIGELDLASDSELYLGAKSASGHLIASRRFDLFAATCPAALSVFLVAEGIHQYKGGEYWPNVSDVGTENPNAQREIGKQFLLSLACLGLETFEYVQEQVHGHKYLTPILLHGGIPRYCTGDLWRLLIRELRDGGDEADQVVAHWLSHQTLLQDLDRPVQRFLRFGGDFAIDLVQRMIDLVDILSDVETAAAIDRGAGPLAEKAALPVYLVETLLGLGSCAIVRRSGSHLARPRVVIDPFSGTGPLVCLPHQAGGTNADRWIVRGRSNQAFTASRAEDREVLLDRDTKGKWLVCFESPGKPSRHYRFVGLDRAPVYMFDERTCELLRDQYRPRSRGLFALSPASVRFVNPATSSTLQELEELPPLSGTWSDWTLRHLDLSDLRCFTVEFNAPSGELRQVRIFVSSRGSRPILSVPTVEGVSDIQGRNVFDVIPNLTVDTGESSLDRWRLRFRGVDLDVQATLADIPHVGNDFELSGVLPGDRLLTGDLQIIGPLGSDLRESIAVVPGLSLDRPARIIGPDEPVSMEISATGVELNGYPGRLSMDFAAGEYAKDIEVVDARVDESIRLLISVPRLLWLVRRRSQTLSIFGHEPIVIKLDELESGDVEGLLVRLGRPSDIQLRLVGENDILQSTGVEQTAGDDGRWVFPLQSFVTTVAHSGLERLEFHLVAGGLRVVAAEVKVTYKAWGISIESIIDETEGFTCCEVVWSEDRACRAREMRLWSSHRLWQEPVTIPIDDGATGSFDFSCAGGRLTAGPYLVEIGLRDQWVQPRRPCEGASVPSVVIGDRSDLVAHLRSLDRSQPLDALELLVAEDGPTSDLVASEVLEEVISSLLALQSERGADAVRSRVAMPLCKPVTAQPERFATWLLRESAGTVERRDLMQLVITLLPDLLNDPRHNICESQHYDLLWEHFVIAGAAFDTYQAGDIVTASRWEYFTGWDPSPCKAVDVEWQGVEPLPERCAPINAEFASLCPARIREIAAVILPYEVKPLLFGGFQQAVFEFLEQTWTDRDAVKRWQSVHSRLNDMRVRQDDMHKQYLEELDRPDGAPALCKFPQELLACAFHLVGIPSERVPATVALCSAAKFADALVERSILLAIALRYLGGHADG
ncbi:MAG: hypothetical protein M1399_08745 [Actinobacteria bacterium]|nr:hypothetical protein [Actinomycetota bacterium]